ncbi:unnamed protein product [Leptidea sinapis]|uniref:CCHC-type domain-containing protein n=1 Tax=Leptidea sinapis TaxID=189913 RepID=A0A5E4PSY7_9NEOP|nr:unnamed protein product [Leptidea sinapis]
MTLMRDHLQPWLSVLAERYKFRQRKQSKVESIADLQKLTKYCEFGTWLEESLRNQFVCGLYSESIRLRLLTETDLKFSKAKDLAIAMEAAETNAAAVENRGRSDNSTPCFVMSSARKRGQGFRKWPEQTRNEVNGASLSQQQRKKVSSGPADNSQQPGQGHTKCRACGGGHASESCKFRLYVCRVCNREGHLKKMCPRLTNITGHNYVEDEYSEEEKYGVEVKNDNLIYCIPNEVPSDDRPEVTPAGAPASPSRSPRAAPAPTAAEPPARSDTSPRSHCLEAHKETACALRFRI